MRRQGTGPSSQASSAEAARARQYLSNPPFYIDCDYEDREKVKLAGAKWSGTAGKWFAPNVDRLRKLVEPGATVCCKPTGLCERSIQHLLSEINKLENAKGGGGGGDAPAPPKTAQAALVPLPLTADENDTQRRRDLNIGVETPEALAELKQALGGALEKDGAPPLSQILEAAAKWALGPHYGLCEAERLLRGLYTELVAKEQVLNLSGPKAAATDAPPPPPPKSRGEKRTRADGRKEAMERPSSATARPAQPAQPAQPARPLHLGLPPQRRPSSLQKRLTQEHHRLSSVRSKTSFKPPVTKCDACNSEIQYQFGSCKCEGLVWAQGRVTGAWTPKDYSLRARADALDAGDAGGELDADEHWEDAYFREQAARVSV